MTALHHSPSVHNPLFNESTVCDGEAFHTVLYRICGHIREGVIIARMLRTWNYRGILESPTRMTFHTPAQCFISGLTKKRLRL